MDDRISGLHHVTAIAGDAQRNYHFYTNILGQRLVKKTVNFDDPGTYHLYYGNKTGTPGTIVTFFPWGNINPGYAGAGMITEIGYAVPGGSLDFWIDRFKKYAIKQGNLGERFGETILPFEDLDGLKINLVIPKNQDNRSPWESGGVKWAEAIRGLHGVTLTLKNITATAEILTDVLGYNLLEQEGNRYRFVTNDMENAGSIDLLEAPEERAGYIAGGTNHHVAFRVKNEEEQMIYREKIAQRGLSITDKIDRNYFYSVYFREPGGVLFELATDNPGFTVDESITELGTHLKLPAQYEKDRSVIEKNLPPILNV